MLTVNADVVEVERRLVARGLFCPGCGGVLAGWGHARARTVRGMSHDVTMRPRRACCRGCGATHVLLSADVLLRRADGVEVIGAALEARASGVGCRPIAARLGRAWETVRGWIRRFGGRIEAVRGWFTRLSCAVGVDPVVPASAGSGWADALASITVAVGAVLARFAVTEVRVWMVVGAVCAGRLLAPGWPADSINTSSPWAVPV